MGTCFSSPHRETLSLEKSKHVPQAPRTSPAIDLNAVSTLSISSGNSAGPIEPRIAPADIRHIDLNNLQRSISPGSTYTPAELHAWEAVLIGRRLVTNGKTTARKRLYGFAQAESSLRDYQSKARTKKGKERAFLEWEREAVKLARRQSEVDGCIPDVEVFETRDLPKHWTATGMWKRSAIYKWRLYIEVDEYGIVTGVGCG